MLLKQFYAKNLKILMSVLDMEAEDNTLPFSYKSIELGVESSSANKPHSIYALSHHPSNACLFPLFPAHQAAMKYMPVS